MYIKNYDKNLKNLKLIYLAKKNNYIKKLIYNEK